MLQKVFQVILKKFPSDYVTQQLEVGLERHYIETHSIISTSSQMDKKSSFIGAIIKEYPNFSEPFSCRFIQINILDSNESNQDQIISLYVSDYFLELCDFSYDEICYVKPVNAHPLEKVVLGAETPDSLDLFHNSKKFSFFVQSMKEDTILCCQGDLPLMPSKKSFPVNKLKLDDLVVLDCQPFRQGLLSLKSSVILADIHAEIANTKNAIKKVPTADSVMKLINYTSNNFLNSSLSQTSSLSLSSALSLLNVATSFEIHIIPKLNKDFERELVIIDANIDPLNTVFISCNSKNLFNLKSGCWVEIGLKSVGTCKGSPEIEQDFHISFKRLAHLCIISNKSLISKYFQSPEVAHISPLLWFNLNNHPSLLIQPEARLHIKPVESNFVPSYADEAYACLIQSPHYDGKINCNTLIKEYFSIPRFVRKGDIFALNSKGQLDFHSKILDEEVDKLKWPVVYFRISQIDGIATPHGHLLSSHYTRLYQSGTKQCYAPITMETYYQLSSYHPIWNGIPNGLSSYINGLQNLILPFLSLKKNNQISSNFLFTGPPCCGKTTVVKAACRCLNLHLYQVNCHEFTGESTTAVESRLKNKIMKGSTYAPCIILLKNVHSIGREREGNTEDSRVIHSLSNLLKEVSSYSAEPILVIGTALDQKQLSNNLVSSFLHSIDMMAPNEEERCLILEELLTACDIGNDVSVRYVAQRTAGFVLGDLTALINQGIKNSYCRIEKFVTEKNLSAKDEEDIVLASVPVVQRDLVNALEKLQSEFADAIGAPKIPNVKFEDVGGLARVKQEILNTIQLPLEYPEILTSGLRRSGVLLYGPPGCGKTLLAKAVATECSLNFLSVKGPELINMYVGQSEENVRAVFNQARSAVPCIIFFDELDSLAPNRGRSGDSGGVMDRVVSQLLAELDGLNKKSEVFVIGATNRPDLIDPALLRPGRFDHLLYVGIPEDDRSKLSILKALTRKFPLASDVKLSEIIKMCPSHMSGADFYSLCSNAVIQRMEKNVEVLEKGGKKMEDLNCEVTKDDFMMALSTLVPSVTPEQYVEYLAIKAKLEQE